MQTHGVNIYTFHADSIYYQVVADSKTIKIESEKDFEIGLKGMYDGYKPKLSAFAVQKTDTVLNGVKGSFVFAVTKEVSDTPTQLFLFFTIINGHCCMVQCSTSSISPALKEVEHFFNSAKFKGENYPNEKEGSIAFKIGQLLGFAITGVVIVFIFYMVRKLVLKLKR
jgi:hypothetical protein